MKSICIRDTEEGANHISGAIHETGIPPATVYEQVVAMFLS
jgi:hypothetical protein